MMNIEAIVEKHYDPFAVLNYAHKIAMRAALTELAAGYEHRIIALNREVVEANERIRQLESERVPDYTGGDAELLRQRVVTDVSRCVTNAYDHIQAEEYSDALSSLLEAREHIAAALPKKEGE